MSPIAMGVEELPAMLKKCAGKKCKADTITTNSGGSAIVIGMGVSCRMVSFVKSDPGAEEHHADPPLPQHHTARSVVNIVKKYQNIGIKVIPVFDGVSRTPLKQNIAGKHRDADSATALETLQKLLKKPWPSDQKHQEYILNMIAKKRKASAKINENTIAEVMQIFDDNGIEYVVAPFEADWQLAHMYFKGIINVIETTDSDFWALLEHPCCFMNVNSTDLKGYLCRSEGCSLLGSNVSIQESGRSLNAPIHHITRVGAIIRATVYGNDYHKGINGLGRITLERFMEEYKDDEDGLIKHLTTLYPSFVEKYEWMDRIYRNTPVFEMSCNNTNLKSRFSITGRIVSHEGKDIEAWTLVWRYLYLLQKRVIGNRMICATCTR